MGLSLAQGIIDVALGVQLVSFRSLTMVIFPLYVGIGHLFHSMMVIGWSFQLQKFMVPDWGMLLFIGIFGVLFLFMIIWNPVLASLTIVVYTAIAFLSIGIFQI